MDATRIVEITERLRAVPGPFRATDGDNSWDLYSQPDPAGHGMKILKAHKHDCPYAEYWPNEAEAAFLVNSWSDIAYLLSVLKEQGKTEANS